MIKNVVNKNKYAVACLKVTKENIIKNRKPVYNPIYLMGLSRKERYGIFWRLFNHDFNHMYKDRYRYISCENMNIDEEYELNKDLIIIEDIDLLVNNDLLQEKVCNMINNCLQNNIQIILCSNKDIDDLELNENLKCRSKWGLAVYLQE